MNRRHIVKGAMAMGLLSFAPSVSLARNVSRLKLNLESPRDQLFALMKMLGGLQHGKEVVRSMKGTVWSIFDDGSVMQPLFDVGALSFSRTWKESEDCYRTTSNFIICYMHLETGEVLEEWYNPWLKRTVRAVNYASRIDTVNRAEASKPSSGSQVRVRWENEGDDVIRWSDGQFRKKNPITPEKWPKASVGEWYIKNQSNQMLTSLTQLEDPDLLIADTLTLGQRHGPWYPWMEMGQAPGRTYRRDITKNVASVDDVSGPIADYATKHFPEYMSAASEWTGVYVDPETLWTRQHPDGEVE